MAGIGEYNRRERLEGKEMAVVPGLGIQQGRAPRFRQKGKGTRLDLYLRGHGSRCFAPQLRPVTKTKSFINSHKPDLIFTLVKILKYWFFPVSIKRDVSWQSDIISL